MKQIKAEFYQTKNKRWRWRLRAVNGRIICNPGEDFTRGRDALRNFHTVRAALVQDWTVEVKG